MLVWRSYFSLEAVWRFGCACWLGETEFLLDVYIAGVTEVSRESSWELVEALFWTLLPPN